MPTISSWAECVFSTPVPEGHTPTIFHLCEGCGAEVKPCWRCQKRGGFLNDCCRTCWNSFACPQPDDPTDPSVAPYFLCPRCNDLYGWAQALRLPLWRFQDKQVGGYKYLPACSCCPMSAKNVLRLPILHPQSDSTYHKIWNPIHARQAYNKERQFSRNRAVARAIYESFFHKQPYRTRSFVKRLNKH